MKGINRDYKPAKLNDEYLHWAKNVVVTENLTSITNEKGSILHSTVDGTIIGVIPINEYSVIFSVPSEIGVLSNTGYTAIPDPNNIFASLNFTTQKPIVGTYQFNNKNECIIAFTDNFNKPKVINIGLLDNPSLVQIDDIKDTLMFPEGTPAIIDVEILDNGGSLLSGVYNVSYAYRNKDVTTNFFQLSAPLSITDDTQNSTFYDGILLNIPTAKALEVTFTGIDTSYEKLVLAVVYRVGSGILANELFEYNITGNTFTAIITQLTDNILLPEEVVVPKVGYRTVKTLTKLNDRLYAGNLTTENDIDYQAQANNIKLNWTIDRTIDITDQIEKSELSNGKNVGYIAGEVYAFYIRLWFEDGSYSRAFHIAGREEEDGDKTLIDYTPYGNIPTYKVTDTVNKNGLSNMGFWENEDEVYPEGFPELEGEKVRHHRFPSLSWLHSNLYGNTSQFGITFLPILGLSVSNVIDLPTNCTHWEILYARRTYTNSTHLVQSIGIHSAYPQEGGGVDTSRIWSSGGNWNTVVDADTVDADRFLINQAPYTNTNKPYKYLRLNSPDVQTGKPVLPIGNVFIKPEYKLTNQAVEVQDDSSNNGQRHLVLSDTLTQNTFSTAISVLPKVMTNYEYLNNNSIGNNFEYYNVRGEYTLQIESNEDLNFGDNAIGTGIITTVDGGNQTITEKYYLFSLVRFPNNCYNTFYLQDTIQTGKLIPSNLSTGTFLSGDGYIVDYSYISLAKNYPKETVDFGDTFAGIRAIHRYMLQTPFNYNLRYITNQPYSRYYPKTVFPDIFGDNLDYPNDIEPNQIAYNREWSFVEVNKPSAIYNPEDDIINQFPLRIIRSEVFNPEEQFNNWKQYLPNDYYEHKERSKGEIINLEGYDTNLIIHQVRGMFLTKERTQFDTSQLAVTLGSGDIFDLVPQEIIPTNIGYAGTLHQIACNLSKIGYAFVDALQGKVFLYNGQLNEISNTGLRNFFEENLVQRETVIEEVTRTITRTYNSTLNITTIPKFQIEYGVEDVIYYDIIPPNGYTSSDEYYFTVGNEAGNITLPALKRFNKKVYQDNPYAGNGYSITYDEEYSRLLLLKTKDCNEETLTRQQTLTRTRYLNTATRDINVNVSPPEAFNGTEGVVERDYTLNSEENVIFVDFLALGLSDKLEIVHNGRVVAYSSMENRTPATDGGYYPYPDRNTGENPDTTQRFPYRTTPAYPAGHAPMDLTGLQNEALFYNSANSVFFNHITGGAWSEWFIGDNRTTTQPPLYASIPDRLTEFEEVTGIVYPMSESSGTTHQQRIWWTYSEEDILTNSTVTIRITGVGTSTVWRFNKYSGVKGGKEWYNGSTWVTAFTQWITNDEVELADIATAETLTSVPQYEYFNGSTYLAYTPADPLNPFADAPTYTQWFNGLTWQNTLTTYLLCGAAFIIEGQILGYYPTVTPKNGDIIIVNTGTEEEPVYKYKEWNGTAQNLTTRDEFLLSYSPANNMWISNHTPKLVNYLFSTYNKYYSLKSDEIYLMNEGERGKYYIQGTYVNDSAFIDVIFNTQQKTLISSIMWNTEVFDENYTQYYNETIDKIRVYTNTQTTDLVVLDKKNRRRVYNNWSYNAIRDVNRYNRKFNRNILDNLELIIREVLDKKVYKRGRFITDVCIVRLEITTDKQVIIHSVSPVIKPVFR